MVVQKFLLHTLLMLFEIKGSISNLLLAREAVMGRDPNYVEFHNPP